MSSLTPTGSPPPTGARPRRPFGRLGCLPAILFGLLLVLALEALINPWAFHMGGRITPLTWSGVGVIQGANGARDVLYARLVVSRRGFASYSKFSRGPSTFTGDALVGTPQGAVEKFTLTGSLHNAWLDAEGAPLTLGFRTPKGQKPAEAFNLHGAFRGSRLVLEDIGTSGHLFRPDGSLDPVGGQFFSTADRPRMQVILDFGGRSEFDALHRRLVARSGGARR